MLRIVCYIMLVVGKSSIVHPTTIGAQQDTTFCRYQVTELLGDQCDQLGLSVGSIMCFPCETPCTERFKIIHKTLRCTVNFPTLLSTQCQSCGKGKQYAFDPVCGDGIDNDNDSFIDEEAPDGVDNDSDTLIDEDTFCVSCSDGIADEDTFCVFSLFTPLPGPTLLEPSSLNAIVSNVQVLLDWSTGSEIDDEGFNILRSEGEEGPYAKISDALIPAKAIAPGGSTYSFVDTTVENGKTYFYKLEDVDTSGKKTEHGPLEITVIEGNTALLDTTGETSTGTVTGDTSGKSSSWFGCGFIRTGGNGRPPTSGEMAGTLIVLTLPFLWVLARAYGSFGEV